MADEAAKKRGAVGVANTFRRTWDKEEYTRKARERAEAEELARIAEETSQHDSSRRRLPDGQDIPVQRAPLQAREYTVDLKQTIGKAAVITEATPLDQRGGYYCDVCECLMKDSRTYLDHINGKKHQRALGMSMRTERASVNQVRARLQRVKELKSKNAPSAAFESRIDNLRTGAKRTYRERKAEAEREHEREREEAERKRAKAEEEHESDPTSNSSSSKPQSSNTQVTDASSPAAAEAVDPELAMAMTMGLPMGFGTSSKKK
mmetsp:Transcript_12324/g.37301  ORF Transcript_12324/g.37301 Transcript_12324/m.37301 type:complete len:263 (-) Transcript_12324:131-919(-)|eukprot:CAMPEP_0177679324 /NCGR_PEP_ID=MMETSP0447-20121125/29535_1 /TAXON_ID=0 /ORGANISM="Stygamoeba regulata, Strain BSH-02190019" /LENGTH=262 /DNA_ID=CAMNT_0019188493 /DNA_START=91 /DNA_END=879 /DNA_ORIENTATION=-